MAEKEECDNEMDQLVSICSAISWGNQHGEIVECVPDGYELQADVDRVVTQPRKKLISFLLYSKQFCIFKILFVSTFSVLNLNKNIQ